MNDFGRPTKYKPEYCQQLIDHMAKGYSFEAFGADVGCGRETLYGWARENKDFSDAKKKGEELGRKFLEHIGMLGLTGQEGRDVKGNPIAPKFNAAVWIFMMKNKFAWKDKVEHSGMLQTKPDKDVVADLVQQGDEDTIKALAVIAKNQADDSKKS